VESRTGRRVPENRRIAAAAVEHDCGRASAARVIVVIGTIALATFALRVVSFLFKEVA
jgi:hypothetical protein